MGYYIDDPNGGPAIYVEGNNPAMGAGSQGQHTRGGVGNFAQILDPRKSALPYVLPYAMWAGAAGGGAGLTQAVQEAGKTAAAGATPGAVAGGATAGGVGAGTAGAGAAATGGGLASLPKILDYAGKGLGAIAASQTHNRDVDNFNTQNQDQDALARAVLGSNNIERDLAQRMYLNQDYQRQAHNSVYGGLLQGAQDVSFDNLPEGIHPATITGGARPSAFTGRQEIGSALQKNALPTLQNPPGLDSLPKIPDVPGVTPLQGASGTEQGLGYLSAGLPILEQLFGSKSQSASPNSLELNVGSQLLPNLLNMQTQQPIPQYPYQNTGTGNATFNPRR